MIRHKWIDGRSKGTKTNPAVCEECGIRTYHASKGKIAIMSHGTAGLVGKLPLCQPTRPTLAEALRGSGAHERRADRLAEAFGTVREELVTAFLSEPVCLDCGGKAGERVMEDRLTPDGMSVSHSECVGHEDPLDVPCEACSGLGFLLPTARIIDALHALRESKR